MTSRAAPRPSDANPPANTADPPSRAPSISLPKGGGAIRGIGEKFAANPVTGTGSMSVPIATSPGRSGFGPQLALSYDSGGGNGPFGLGWNLALPAISRTTDKSLPRYHDGQEQAPDSDVFILSGAEDLVPVYQQDASGDWLRDAQGNHVIHDEPRVVAGATYRVRRYRPRLEGLFARIERWTNAADATDVFWRSIAKDNVTTWYGRTPESRISDPADPKRIFSWLLCETHDDKGQVLVYAYQTEDSAGVDLAGVHERNRTPASRSAQRYPKRIRYGNRQPYFPDLRAAGAWPEPPGVAVPDPSRHWLFEVVFDYGEGHLEELPLDLARPEADQHRFVRASSDATSPWPVRPDPFSAYRAGFEVRTYRLCRRVLMFHHIPDLPTGEPGYDGLVRSTDFAYARSPEPSLADEPVYSKLIAVTQSGYSQQAHGTHLKKSLPPLEFEYTEPAVRDALEDVDPASLKNLPIGLDGNAYRWIDLHGEGIPGILTEQAGAWFYKRNLSPLMTGANGTGAPHPKPRAWFAPLEAVALKPNLALATGAEFMDLAGDGQPDLVVTQGPTPGLYEHDHAEGWQPFRPFTSRLNRDFRDPNLRLVDLDGDGHADVLITEDDALVWHPSLAEAGFGPARRVPQARDEEHGPRLVFADGTQSIHLADLSGDGLTDLVRVRNGEVCYWPNLGYGRFGAKVTMADAPWFDHPDQFDPKRLRLADIDGSGTIDLVYLHRDGVRLYFNQSGNGWSQPRTLSALPPAHDLASVQPVDLLGNGTACLVWSSPLPGDTARPMRYVSLMGDEKPHLLVKTVNNLGAETRVHYAPSTKFYLRDNRDGQPWITRLPFPVHVVERVETYDHISRNRFVTRYAYHHGYYDGEEREFRGFGMVEQWDTEEFAALRAGDSLAPTGGDLPAAGPAGDRGEGATNLDATSHVPPVRTKTWFHTGAHLDGERISRQFEREYYREPGLTDDEAQALLLPDTVPPGGLTLEEEREACRALKGSMLRQEVYADDASHPDATPEEIERARTPYTVTEQNFSIRVLQPRGDHRHAVFFTHARESLSYHYERNPADPRIQHALTLEVDDFGNVLKQAAIGYGRIAQIRLVDDPDNPRQVPNPGLTGLEPADQAKQTTPLLTYTENRVTNAVGTPDTHRTPLPCEALTFELTGYPPTGAAGRCQASDFVEPDPSRPDHLRLVFTAEVPYESAPTARPCRRPIECVRTLYRPDDLGESANNDPLTLLPLGELESLGLPGASYQLAFTPGLLAQVFVRGAQSLLPVASNVLGGRGPDGGGYVNSQDLRRQGLFPTRSTAAGWQAWDADDHWWVTSGRSFHTDNPRDSTAAELAEARRHFFLPRRHRDPFDQDAFVDFDAFDLLLTETRDALGNRVTVAERAASGTILRRTNDYRVLQPRLVSDPNRNRTAVAFDTLGLVVATAVMGKPDEGLGDKLDGLVADLAQTMVEEFFARPQEPDPHQPRRRSRATAIVHALLGSASTRIVYDLHRFQRTRADHPSEPDRWEPPFAATIVRETHVSDLPPGETSRLQVSFSYSDGFGREIQRKVQAEPGPFDVLGPLSPTANPRWVGSGWTIFNNKGKPVRQYEPFFSQRRRPEGTLLSDHRFEFGVTAGVSPVLFYDPAGRVIATLHPNHTYEKVVFDPWQQTTYDVNDTCAARNAQTGDPRTDADIRGYVAEYFKVLPANPAEPWQTWYARRIGDHLRPHEREAAVKAAAHADTPTTAHFDALGRPFLTVARNRVVCEGHSLHDTEESFATRVELDIEGNQREVRDAIVQAGDPLGRIVMRYAYDLLGNRIRQESMEAGTRWMLNDVAGKPIRAWDSRGHEFTTAYDELRRPLRETVLGATADADPRTRVATPIVFDRIEYGERIANAEALNLRTRTYRHSDSAGVATNAQLDVAGNPIAAYDFKGNLLRSTRKLVTDYKAIPNWRLNPQLDAESFEGSTRYDALNRPIQSTAPRSSLGRGKFNVIQPVFNEASLLERVDVWLEHAAEPGALLDPDNDAPSSVGVANLDYDAKGRRLRIDYKNGATISYAYDPLTFRLAQLLTKRKAADFPGDDPQSPVAGWPGKQVQNLHYTYDPAGNITHIRDDAQQTIYFKNQRVESGNDYTYDALYRLIQASGREHLGQAGGAPIPHSHDDASRVGLLHPADGNAMGTYIERYVYDAVGNFEKMQHRGSDPASPGWTRRYAYGEESLIEGGKQSNRLSRTQVGDGVNSAPEPYQHDAHGNMLRMPHLGGGQPGPNMDWDYKDQLRRTDLGGGNAAYYAYDASGRRVRKVVEKNNGNLLEERIYLGGFELFRKHNGPIGANTATLERETLHVMDDKQRIALVETRTLDTAGADQAPRRLVRYQFGNHLGSASLELDEQAQIISYEEYSPYGNTTYQAVRRQTDTPKRYRFTGKERDEESGLYYHRVRYYAPWLGSWVSCDPSGVTDSPNLLQFVRSNPIVRSDASGMQSEPVGNPGERLASVDVQCQEHALYLAVPGTWVSASARAEGLGTVFTRQSGYGTYLGVALNTAGVPLADPDHLEPGDTYLIPTVKGLQAERCAAELAPEERIEGWLAEERPRLPKPNTRESVDRTDAEHEARVIAVVNYYLDQAQTDQQKGVFAIRSAHSQLIQLREDKQVPRSSESLILRDAERYLWGLGGGSSLLAQESGYGILAMNAVDTFLKEQGIRVRGHDSDLPSSAPGGSAWVRLGVEHRKGLPDVPEFPATTDKAAHREHLRVLRAAPRVKPLVQSPRGEVYGPLRP